MSDGMSGFLKNFAYKGLWIVLLCIRHDGGRVQSNEGGVYDAQFVQLPDQTGHNRLQFGVIHLMKKAVISVRSARVSTMTLRRCGSLAWTSCM